MTPTATDRLLTSVHDGATPSTHAVATLGVHCQDDIAEALDILDRRDDLLAGVTDQYTVLGCEPRAGVDVMAGALASLEHDYSQVLRRLCGRLWVAT